jgi:hypothetical protein
VTIRQFGELFAQIVAARSGLLADPQDTQADLLRRLRVEGSYPANVLELFHQLRMAGNAATHRREGDHATALARPSRCYGASMRAPIIAYIRASTDKQGKSGLGLEAQREAIARFAAAEALEVASEFIEVETGKGADALDIVGK